MESIPPLTTAADLESHAARIADPGIDLKTKYNVACELRENIDNVRDAESARVIPHMVPVLLELLRSGEPSFQKDALEYSFRRVLLEILHRIPATEIVRTQALPLLQGMLHILRIDNEENGITCCKTITDIVRSFRALTPDLVQELMKIFLELCSNLYGLVHEVLSENSPTLDANVVFPSTRSFKVLSELVLVVAAFSQNNKTLVLPVVQDVIPSLFSVLSLEAPAQKKAREDYEAMGGFWSGMAPTIKNPQVYADYMTAEVKLLQTVAFFLRMLGDQMESYGETLVLISLRMLQDLPTNAITNRKELIQVFRHMVTAGPAGQRKAILPQLDKLFDERVVLGTAMGSQETIRSLAYGVVADLIHHLRAELTPAQLTRACTVFLGHLHNPYLTNQIHILSAKVIYNMVEHIVSKENSQAAGKLLTTLLESSVDKLESMTAVHAEIIARTERQKKIAEEKEKGTKEKKDGEDDIDITYIEKARPISHATYTILKVEELYHDYRLVFRTLLHGFRHILMGLKKCDAPVPDGAILSRLFEGCTRCMALFDGESRDYNDALEWFGGILTEVELHVFQEIWTQKMPFFFDAAQKRPTLCIVLQGLFTREPTSPCLVSIILRFLLDRLEDLGEYDDQTAAVTIRLYKMVFSAVTLYPATNEPILATQLGKLIMDCFPLATKSSKPTNFFHLLRVLFRAIGGGGGRFELIYKEVLPLLPEMLECLNRQLHASEGLSKDMIVELCLTVPLRLTHLLPYLSYLMQPLALALRGGPELVTQGLRTLELCIDNLIPDFLDPTLGPVLRELMEALHNHLKPLPANHQHSHTTIRILGKLGGRNRSLLYKEPQLFYRPYSDRAKIRVSFGSSAGLIELGPVSVLALRTLTSGRAGAHYRDHAYEYMETCLKLVLAEGTRDRDREELLTRSLESVFESIHLPELEEKASSILRDASIHIFTLEARRSASRDPTRKFPSSLLRCFLDALPRGLARTNATEAQRARDLMSTLLQELSALKDLPDISIADVLLTVQHLSSTFNALCLDDSAVRKRAGCHGFRLLANIAEIGSHWAAEQLVNIVRTLLHVLKDMPYDLPNDVDEVVDVLVQVIRVGGADLTNVDDGAPTPRNKLSSLVGILFGELSSPNPIVRRVIHRLIELLVEITGKTTVELLSPHRERILTAIYTKPLRALPFNIQIGMIEAVRYCLSTDPPLPELNDELLRLLHEALALADADDQVARGGARQGTLESIKLRVACIRLLTASMPLTDFFAKQPQTRQRVTSVYFKSLYSPTPEVKDVAHEGMRVVLIHQSRLPKELLQTGLRPILMNLSDPKRLSIPGLEGLARLLELLTNYFKVEIGHKLLDHFRYVADPQTLQATSRLPLTENEAITKLVRLANIFHLLPSAANIFLNELVNSIVQTEAHMHFAGQSPFSEPLAKYLDRYPVEAIDFFMRHLQLPRHVRTLRSILQAKLAPNVLRELTSRTSFLVTKCIEGRDPTMVLPGLMLCSDMSTLVPNWLTDNPVVVDSIVSLWRVETVPRGRTLVLQGEVNQRCSIILKMLMQALQETPRVDLLFDLIAVFSHEQPFDLITPSQFLYHHVALNESLIFRRNVLLRFQTWFDDPLYSWTHKTFCLRFIITPMLLVQASKSRKEGLLDHDVVQWMHRRIWMPMNDSTSFVGAGDLFVIELLHLTTVMVHRYPEFLEDAKKDIIKCAWHFITSEDPVVKQTSYLLAARFFDAFPGPQKFILRVWTGLLRPPHAEGKALIRQALDILAPVLARTQSQEPGVPQWAKTTRRILAEEGSGWSQIGLIYQLIIRQPDLFYPVRALFTPHIVNYLAKLGLSSSSNAETRLLSIDLIQVIFDWEQKTSSAGEQATTNDATNPSSPMWLTPLPFRESMVSYLVRMAGQDPQTRNPVTNRALALLRSVLTGWTDVTVQLGFFARNLQQNELNNEQAIAQAVSTARVLQVVAAEKQDDWFTENAEILTKLVRKGMVTDEAALNDALHPVFDRLIRLFPLPKEDELQQSNMSDFHGFVYSSISDSFRTANNLRGALLMLKSVVQVTPERIEPFSSSLMKALGVKARDHIQSSPNGPGFDNLVRMVILILEISQITVAHLGDQRKYLIQSLCALVEKSKSPILCRFILDLAREWTLTKPDSIPTLKEKATLLQKMTSFETRGERAEALFNSYLELIYEIYTEPSLRRTDLTVRLEHPFLVGCRSINPSIRERFVDLMDVSVPRSLFSRLSYILGAQSWEPLADHNWIHLAINLLLGCVDSEQLLLPEKKGNTDTGASSLSSLGRVASVIRPMQHLLFLDPRASHEAWVSVFPAAWACLSRREQVDINHHMITLLSKDYHISQSDLRPNIIQTLLAGIIPCSPPLTLPPHLLKYLAKNFGAWYTVSELLEASLDQVRDDELVVREPVYDSLTEVYAELSEDDMFYGVWRRRSLHSETSEALSFEQIGMWEQAQHLYEQAQSKARANVIPFSEAEYCLWEDHWVLAAEKLQQWDTLYELARSDSNHDLLLESAWRTKDWPENRESLEEQLSQIPEVPTPRRRIFEAFITLLKTTSTDNQKADFTRLLEDAMQLSLRKWTTLPHPLSHAHVALLQNFQQFVELQEAVQIFASLSTTTAQNLEKKSSDLKMVLQAWRERLPDPSDDISIWSDLVAWRQNVFHAINKAYIPLIQPNQGGSAAQSTNTYGYRGYHETAWIINRFARIARKHGLLDVCFNSLNKIYTLPNIEISEAFLKLREQARCHYQKQGDLQAGLEVINNTNLMYFSASQKAEFYTLKGMFHAKFGRNDEANQAFGQAVQLDMQQAKAWAAWGKFNDRMFKENPTEISHASSAVSCYLQAAGLWKNHKSRPLLTRVLWLLSIDDNSFTISRAFDTYKGDAAYWYWITLIPELCQSISQREVKQARYILLNLAKLFPQALFFPLRTTRDDMVVAKRQAAQRLASQARRDGDHPMHDATGEAKPGGTEDGANGHPAGQPQMRNPGDPTAAYPQQRAAWDYVEEVVQILKTAFPLLIMSMETIVEQIGSRIKAAPEEEIYRLVCMLMQDALAQYVVRIPNAEDEGMLGEGTIGNLTRLAESMQLAGSGIRREYEEDFLKTKLSLQEYIRRLQRWRDKYERWIDSRPPTQTLDTLSHYLTDFQYSKFDEIEVPGQYTEDKTTNQQFVRIAKFDPKFEHCRVLGFCWRRIKIHGHDNSKTSFAVQMPAPRQCRREERAMQLFRTFNQALQRKKESRKRNLRFHIPAVVPCGANFRLVENDGSYINFADIYDQYCESNGLTREDATFLICEKVRAALREYKIQTGKSAGKSEFLTVKKEVYDELRAKIAPDNIITNYMIRTMVGPSELWRMRKQFTLQLAAINFMSFVLHVTSRVPSRFHLSRATGQIAMTEIIPGMSQVTPVFGSNDAVPFRFTPNMQHFVGPILTEGVLTASMVAIARCLTEPEYELEQQLCLYARDEVTAWLNARAARGEQWSSTDIAFRQKCAANIDGVVKRAELMACKHAREQALNSPNGPGPNSTPILKTAVDLISAATNPISLIKMTEIWVPWF